MEAILGAARPLVMVGAAGNRPSLVDALSTFVTRTHHSDTNPPAEAGWGTVFAIAGAGVV